MLIDTSSNATHMNHGSTTTTTTTTTTDPKNSQPLLKGTMFNPIRHQNSRKRMAFKQKMQPAQTKHSNTRERRVQELAHEQEQLQIKSVPTCMRQGRAMQCNAQQQRRGNGHEKNLSTGIAQRKVSEMHVEEVEVEVILKVVRDVRGSSK